MHTHVHMYLILAGRSFMKQYMPVKKGFKVWVKADVSSTFHGTTSETGLGETVVLQLSV